MELFFPLFVSKRSIEEIADFVYNKVKPCIVCESIAAMKVKNKLPEKAGRSLKKKIELCNNKYKIDFAPGYLKRKHYQI